MRDGWRGVLSGAAEGVPIALGYLPISFSFGVAASRGGLGAADALGLSLIVYAGAAQFLALALIAAGAALPVAAITLVAMNLRHLVYGPALMRAAGPDARRRHAWAWGWGLTDEVFGAALAGLARGRRFSEPRMLGLAGIAYAAWLSGTLAGVLTGSGGLDGWPLLDAAMGFMLPALFLSLLLSVLARRQLPVIAVAGAVTVAATLWIGGTTGLLAGMATGAVAGIIGGDRGRDDAR